MKQILKNRPSEKVPWQIIHVLPCKQKGTIKREALMLDQIGFTDFILKLQEQNLRYTGIPWAGSSFISWKRLNHASTSKWHFGGPVTNKPEWVRDLQVRSCTWDDSVLVRLQNDDIRYGVFITVVDRSPGVFIAVIGQFQFGGRWDVQHDHSWGVHRQLEVGIAFQCICLSTEDISDLEKSKSDCVDKSKPGIFLNMKKLYCKFDEWS